MTAPEPGALANLDDAGVAARRRRAYLALAVALVVLLGMRWGEAPYAARALLFLPLFLAAEAWLEAGARTSRRLATRGRESGVGGDRPVADAARADALRRQASRLRTHALVLAAGATGAALVFAL